MVAAAVVVAVVVAAVVAVAAAMDCTQTYCNTVHSRGCATTLYMPQNRQPFMCHRLVMRFEGGEGKARERRKRREERGEWRIGRRQRKGLESCPLTASLSSSGDTRVMAMCIQHLLDIGSTDGLTLPIDCPFCYNHQAASPPALSASLKHLRICKFCLQERRARRVRKYFGDLVFPTLLRWMLGEEDIVSFCRNPCHQCQPLICI